MTNRARIFYSTDILPTDDIRARLPKRQQSAAASALLSRLEIVCPQQPSAVSKSHSRAVIAVAAGIAPVLHLGIDVEWIARNRPFDRIATMFMASDVSQKDAQTFYRGWTFFEAHYKAFQRFPEERLVRRVIAHSSEDRLDLGDGIGVMQFDVAGDFRGCLVWRHDGGETEISRIDCLR